MPPLFVNVNDRAWNPDLIGFDSSRVYGTPSYYVQKLFSNYRGTHVLPTKVSAPMHSLAIPQGAIGLGTWATQAEYRDIRVTHNGQTLYAHDFANGSEGWRVLSGDWQVVDGNYRQSDSGEDRRALAGNFTWSDYTYSVRARKLGGAEGFLIMFRVRDRSNWYWWNLGGWGNTKHAVEKCLAGNKSIISNEVAGSIETGRWYDIRIEVQGSRIRCYLDNTLIHDFEDANASAVYAVASRNEKTREIILKMVNVSDQALETAIELQNAPTLSPKGKIITLTSANPEDENSLEAPTRVAPVESLLEGVSSRLRLNLPAYSLTVLVLKEQ